MYLCIIMWGVILHDHIFSFRLASIQFEKNALALISETRLELYKTIGPQKINVFNTSKLKIVLVFSDAFVWRVFL